MTTAPTPPPPPPPSPSAAVSAALDAAKAALAAEPGPPPSLAALHARGAAAQRAGEHAAAAAFYTLTLDAARARGVTHADLHITAANAAAAWLSLCDGCEDGAGEEATAAAATAVSAAAAARAGAGAAVRAGRAPCAALARATALHGAALARSGQHAAGVRALDAALGLAPADGRVKALHSAVVAARGGGRAAAAAAARPRPPPPPPPPALLPARLLTPSAARADPATRDTLTHLEVACDTEAPRRALGVLADGARTARLEGGVAAAVRAVAAAGAAPAVLDLGGGLWAGRLAAAGVAAGARRATVLEPRLYLAAAARAALDRGRGGGGCGGGAAAPPRVTVLHATPTALRPGAPSNPPPANVVVLAGMITDCGLGGGALPALAAATAAGLVVWRGSGGAGGGVPPRFVPSAVAVWFQLASLLTRPEAAAGLDVGAVDAHRAGSACSGGWGPGGADGGPVCGGSGGGGRRLHPGDWAPLSAPAPAPGLAVSFADPPTRASEETVAVPVTAVGTANAVVAWTRWAVGGDGGGDGGGFENGARPATSGEAAAAAAARAAHGPRPLGAGPPSTGPVIYYLGGALDVAPGEVVSLRVAHNTAAVRFAFAAPPPPHPTVPRPLADPAWPRASLAALADAPRNAAFDAAIGRAVARARARAPDGAVAALCLGAPAGRAGFLAVLAARAGADSAVALEVLPAAAALARTWAAAAGVADRVCVLAGRPAASPAATLRTTGSPLFPPSGVNLFISDAWDGSLLGHGGDAALAAARAAVGSGDPVVVPARARLWCAGVAAHTPAPGGGEAGPGGGGGGGGGRSGGSGSDDSPGHPLDAFRWAPSPVPTNLDDEPHSVLTRPALVVEAVLDAPEGGSGGSGSGSGSGGTSAPTDAPPPAPAVPRASAPLSLPVLAPGRLTAVALWTDLVLDEETTYTTAPAYARAGGELAFDPAAGAAAGGGSGGVHSGGGGGTAAATAATPPPPPPHVGQALQALDRWVAVAPGASVRLVARFGEPAPGNAAGLRIALRRPPLEGPAGPAAPDPPSGWAARPPWCEAWGGGDSVENPHVQRVRYGQLVIQDWVGRVRAGAAGRSGGGGGGVGGGGAAGAALALCGSGEEGGDGDDDDDGGGEDATPDDRAAAAADAGRHAITDDLRALGPHAGCLGLHPPTVSAAAAALALTERLHVCTRVEGGGVYGGEAPPGAEEVGGGGWTRLV